jgi:serine phosphatase RsbU (regulator of sigma subunit)
MPLVPLLESLIVAAAVIFTIRGAPSDRPRGGRLLAIGLLLLLQVAVVYVLVAILRGVDAGVRQPVPTGLVIATQLARLGLLIVAGRLWWGLVRGSLARWTRFLVVAGFLALAGSSALNLAAAMALLLVLRRLPWIREIRGWRRAVGLVLAAGVLVALTWVPAITVNPTGVATRLEPRPEVWPPPLVAGQGVAGVELALARPLDRAVQALIDVARVQLLALVVQFLFLPIRLSGMSLKRRFWLNHVLVRSIPSLLSGLILLGGLYLGFGYTRAQRVRAVMEQTLARAATTANALADLPGSLRDADDARLELARRWMGPEDDRVFVVARGASWMRASPETPPAVVDAAATADSTASRGLYVRGDGLWLAASRPSARETLEVWVPVDTAYLARAMRTIGGDARLRVRPSLYVGEGHLAVDPDSSWTGHPVTVRHVEPATVAGRGRTWFLNRTDLPAGDWSGPRGERRGAIELRLDITPQSLIRHLLGSLGGLSSNLFLLLVVMFTTSALGLVEGFAVRSGKSIIQAVLDEVGVLRKAADEFGAGRLDYRVPVTGRDELGVLARSFNDMAANLERQRKELIAAERLEEDLAVAREIQQRFLPQQAPGVPGLDVAGTSIPSREVGGDLFYWFTHDDGSLGIALGDVAGKSVPAALLMSNVLSALRAQAAERVDLSTSLERTNRLMIEQIEPGRFVTLFYGEADPARGVLRYASAGHNPPLLLRAGGAVEWLREGGVPLGVVPAATYRTVEIPFVTGDTLVVFSDGVTEAQGPRGTAPAPGGEPMPELFGDDRLLRATTVLVGRSARETLEGLLERLRAFAAGVEQADDVTIVVVRRV